MGFQFVTLHTGRYQCAAGAVMEVTQITVSQAFQRAHAVVFDVLMEIGVKAAEYGNATGAGGADRGPAHRTLGGDVDCLRGETVNGFTDAANQRKTKAQGVVAGNGQARQGDAVQFVVAGGEVCAVLTRADNLNFDAA